MNIPLGKFSNFYLFHISTIFHIPLYVVYVYMRPYDVIVVVSTSNYVCDSYTHACYCVCTHIFYALCMI